LVANHCIAIQHSINIYLEFCSTLRSHWKFLMIEKFKLASEVLVQTANDFSIACHFFLTLVLLFRCHEIKNTIFMKKRKKICFT